jgi:hypothetical protein
MIPKLLSRSNNGIDGSRGIPIMDDTCPPGKRLSNSPNCFIEMINAKRIIILKNRSKNLFSLSTVFIYNDNRTKIDRSITPLKESLNIIR